MSRIYSFFIFMSMSWAGVAQSPITLNNSNMPGNGDTLRYTNILVSSLGNYTQTGVNFNWDFSQVTSLTEGVRSFKSSLLTPYAFFFASFTGFAEKIADSIVMGPVKIKNYFNFYKKQTSPAVYQAEGVGMTFSSIPIPSFYSDKDELYHFPMTFPKYDSTTFRFSTITTTMVPFSYSKTGYRVTQVDGWGVISTPDGTAHCLRLVTTQHAMDTVKISILSLPIPAVERSYQWLTTNSKIPYLEITGRVVANNFVPTVARYRGFKKEAVNTTGISEQTNTQKEFLYPNPVKDRLQFGGNLTEVVIYDLNGKEVLRDQSGAGAAFIDVSSLVPGAYILIGQRTGGIPQSFKFLKE